VNLQNISGHLRKLAFRASRLFWCNLDGGKIAAFGTDQDKIGMILIVNLDRQPQRLRWTLRELSRFRTYDGAPLTSIVRRLPAVDARDGRAIASTADVDPAYNLGNQLYVQPDVRLAECFDAEEPIRMSRQEIAIAKSHIEAWKAIVAGRNSNVLVLEDDIWFSRGAAAAIDRGWTVAAKRCATTGGPRMLYFSYEDAGGTAARTEVCDSLFRPLRGLWFLSGYVLSREGAGILLRSMPVVGPVDMWINYRFKQLGALALSSPVIKQRPDGKSDNSYSILPYLARAGIVDASAVGAPRRVTAGPVFAWTARRDREGMAMALSMLGLRVRVFDGDAEEISEDQLPLLIETFDALVDPPLRSNAARDATAHPSARFVLEMDAQIRTGMDRNWLPASRTLVLPYEPSEALWSPLCSLLGIAPPAHAFPAGPSRKLRVFRDDRAKHTSSMTDRRVTACPMDDSPWALLPESNWPPLKSNRVPVAVGERLVHDTMSTATQQFPCSVETFPGNLAAFDRTALMHGPAGAQLILNKSTTGGRPYRSGAFASVRTFDHGRFEAEIKVARGSGLVTGFFLHRDSPRQEIDIEVTGDNPRCMLANVYFNPGDEGTAIGYGYRGSPCRIDLGFDASLDFHLYAIDWRPGCIDWLVDGRIVHSRVGWDPTPLPHLPMRLHGNLWAPRSKELAGLIDEEALPSMASFRNVSIWA
jgi:GR25 family glycosyltransferase involved in LPS biosynthesis